MIKIMSLIFIFFFYVFILNSEINENPNLINEKIGYFTIKKIPTPPFLNTSLCVYWEFNLKNVEKVEIFIKTLNGDKKIFEKTNNGLGFFKYNSWKDHGISHCPFKSKSNLRDAAIYYYKIKIKNIKILLKKIFVIKKNPVSGNTR